MRQLFVTIALKDIRRALGDFGLAFFLAWEDIRQRYVRTLLGPLWIVLSTGVWFSALGFVMANLFGQKIDEYLPFMVTGLLTWTLIATSISECSQVLVNASPIINAFPIPIFTHYLRFALRNFIIFLHNLIILLIVLAIYPPEVTAATWLVIPGLFLVLVILMSMAVILSLVNLRYRDTHLAVASAMQVLPFVTPVFWDRGMLKAHHWIADLNPFYHMLNIVRSPMLGQSPDVVSWIVTISMAVLLFLASSAMFVRYRHRIIFWL